MTAVPTTARRGLKKTLMKKMKLSILKLAQSSLNFDVEGGHAPRVFDMREFGSGSGSGTGSGSGSNFDVEI